MIATILLVFAFFFAIAAFCVPVPARFNLIGAGLAFWVLAELRGRAKILVPLLIATSLAVTFSGCTTTTQPNGSSVTAFDPAAAANVAALANQEAAVALQTAAAVKAMQKTATPAVSAKSP